jgi:hypothetical protein
MPAAARNDRLPRVNLPARIAFVNPDSAHHGPRREAGGASIIPPDANSFRRDQGATTVAPSLLARVGGQFDRGANHRLSVSHPRSRRQQKLEQKKRKKPRFYRTMLPFATETSSLALASFR